MQAKIKFILSSGVRIKLLILLSSSWFTWWCKCY